MGYSTSEQTLIKMLPHLKLLDKGMECVWSVDPGKPTKKFAYKIREALYIASEYFPEKYPNLARAARMFELKVDQASGKISAQTVSSNVLEVETTEGISIGKRESDGRSLNYEGEQSTATVIQSWIDAGEGATRLYFPNATLTNEELTKLYNWASKRDLLMFVSGEALTVQVMDEELADLAWNPNDLEGVL